MFKGRTALSDELSPVHRPRWTGQRQLRLWRARLGSPLRSPPIFLRQPAWQPDRNPNWGEEDVQDAYFQKIKAQFIDKGIPILMGEYGAYRRNGSSHEPLDLATHNDAVDYWITFVTKEAKTRGIVPFWWDTGGALNRTNLTVKDQRTIDALIAGAQ